MTTDSRNRKSWSNEEDQYLIENWRTKSDATMAIELQRREQAVKGRRATLGLVSVARRNNRPAATSANIPILPAEQQVQVIEPQGLPNFHKLPTMIVVDLANEPISAANRLSELLTQNNFKFAAM